MWDILNICIFLSGWVLFIISVIFPIEIETVVSSPQERDCIYCLANHAMVCEKCYGAAPSMGGMMED
jgi:hypothetical protein